MTRDYLPIITNERRDMKALHSRKYWLMDQAKVREMVGFMPIAIPPGTEARGQVKVGYLSGADVFEVDPELLTKEFNEFLNNENLQLLDKIQDLEAELHNTKCLTDDPDEEFWDDYQERGW